MSTCNFDIVKESQKACKLIKMTYTLLIRLMYQLQIKNDP